MALSIDQLNAVTKKHIAPRIADNLFDAVPMLFRLKNSRREQVTGATSFNEPIIYQGTGQASGFSGDGPLPTTSQEHLTAASFALVSYQVPLVVSERQLADNSGPEGVHKILSVIEEVARLDLQDKMGNDLFSGNGSASDPLALDGLDLMVDDDDSPKNYGGIATTDFSGWKADDAASFGEITLKKLQGVIGDVTFGTDRPSLILCSQDAYDKIWDILQADQRFAKEEEADGGFRFLRVSGVPVMVDQYVTVATAGSDETMYFMNEKYLYWYVHRDVNMKMLPFQRPDNSWNRIGHIITLNQLVTNRRKAHARRTGVDPSL